MLKLLSLIFLLFLFDPQRTFAGDIIINEIMYDLSGTDTDREWIEIYNTGISSVDLSNWRFKEGGTNHTLIQYQGGLSLASGDYAVIVDNPSVFLNDHSGFSGIIIDSSFSLSNTGETLTILEGDLSTVSDEVAYQSSWGGSGTGGSLERKSSTGLSNDLANWQEGIVGGTPGAISSSGATPTPTPTPSPSPSVTASSTSTPTSTLTTSSTSTPKATSSKSPNPTPTPLATNVSLNFGTRFSTEESQVLGTASATPSPQESIKPQVKTLGKSENVLQKAFIIIGILSIITSLVIFGRQWIKQYLQKV